MTSFIAAMTDFISIWPTTFSVKILTEKIIRQGSVILLYSEIHENDNDLIPFILETKDDPRTKRLGNYSKARALLLVSTSQLANHNYDSVPLRPCLYEEKHLTCQTRG